MANEKKRKNNILRRPLFRLVLFIAIIVAIIVVICKVTGKKDDDTDELVGYQRLVDISDEQEYRFLDVDGNLKTYTGYKSMSDFYYDTACVSRENEDDSSVTEYGLITKNEGTVVKFGTYDNIIQVIGGEYYKVYKDSKYGVIDYDGKVVIEPTYDSISVTTVQDGTELVFECRSNTTFEYFNENGKSFMTTEETSRNVSYVNSLNSNFDTIVKITAGDNVRYFNLRTGDELFTDVEKVSISYNILKQDNQITIYGTDYQKSKVIDTSSDYSVEARAYFSKYVLVEQKNVNSGNREYKYTVYDEDLKVVAESENKINIVKSYDDEVYFVINEDDGVKIKSENGGSKKVKGYEFNSSSISDLQALVLNPIGDTNTTELYSFKGKKLDENIAECSFKGTSLTVKNQDSEKYLLFANKNKYALTDNDSVSACEYYILVENTIDSTVSLISNEGKTIIDKAQGSMIFYNEKYIGIQVDKTVNIYSTKSGKVTYSYSTDDYIDKDETVNYVELTDGYYTFAGKKVIEK